MNYASWMKAEFAAGASLNQIARASLDLPLAQPSDQVVVQPLLERVAEMLKVDRRCLYIVGSVRYGFSLRDGASFNPRFSDLNVAVVHQVLHEQCNGTGPQRTERDLPAPDRVAFRRAIVELARTVQNQFSSISTILYPDLDALIDVEANKIGQYLGLRNVAPPIASQSLEADFGSAPFNTAIDAGLPRFLDDIEQCPATRASPYVVDESGFRTAFDTSPARHRLLEALDQALFDLKQVVDVRCCLIGGSFVNPGSRRPRDMDMAVFYRAAEYSPVDIGPVLSHLARKLKLRCIDARFIPSDAEPWLVVKMASFFTSLYQSDRNPAGHDRGLVLLIPAASPSRASITDTTNASTA